MTSTTEKSSWTPGRPGRALVAAAAFALSLTLFLILAHRVGFPATARTAVGRVTLEGASKLRDYVLAAIFFLFVPIVAAALDRLTRRTIGDTVAALPASRRSPQSGFLVTLLVCLPLLAAPVIYLVTLREGWAVLFPVALSQIASRLFVFAEARRWLRAILAPPQHLWYGLLVTESAAWLLFRYLHAGSRIGHDDSLLVELLLIALFCISIPAVAVLSARVVSVAAGADAASIVRGFATGGLPLLLLPFLALARAEPQGLEVAAVIAAIAGIVVAAAGRWSMPQRAARAVLVAFAVPALLLCANYAAIASPWHWIDLFHRGESLGPASDYLLGKVPYRDTFVLHGLLDDGFLDASLMRLFGRTADVSIARSVILGAFISPALWIVGLAATGTMPLALLTVGAGWVTAADNQRAILALVVAALLIRAYRRGSGPLAVLAGALAAVALFQSLDIGIYTIGGGVASLVALAIWDRRMRNPERGTGAQSAPTPLSGHRDAPRTGVSARSARLYGVRTLPFFLLGVVVGAAPFLVYLAAKGALGAFLRDSFVTIPRVIDAVWSLPYPDLAASFVQDLSLRGIALFLLSEKVRFLLNPLVLGIALTVLVSKFFRRSTGELDRPLLVIAIFGVLTQRSALGRADFPHQYFAAFFVAPAIVLLLAMAWSRIRSLWSRAPAFAATLAALLLGFLTVVLWVPDLAKSRIDETLRYRARMAQRPDLAPPDAAATAERVARIHEEVDRISYPGSPMFDFSNQPALYFYLGRPNPTRFYQVPILSPPELQKEAILALERTRPRVVIRSSEEGTPPFDQIPADARAAGLAAYLDDRYQFGVRRGGVEIWTRRPGSRPLDLARYMALARAVPEIPSFEHLLFPSVASIDVSDARWRSDVEIHNPFTTPLPLRLRYVSGRARDADIELGPNQTWRAQDVVASLFGAPGTFGSLRIGHPPGRRPVAVASSYDAAKGGAPAVMVPVSDSSKGVAGQQLVLLGLDPRGRRVNLGVLSTGATELSVRIVLTAADGAPAGRVVEKAVPEQESWVLANAESALEAPVTPGSAIRILVEKGEGIAWVSLIDPASGASETLMAVPSAR